MEKVDVAIVGAGLAGLAAAYCLADDGFDVLVVERGDYPGSKNVSGGRLYLNPLRPLLSDLWSDAPLERPVTKERLSIMSEGASATVELASQRLRESPGHSFTVLRSRFDRWLADRAAERGAMIVPKYAVDDLLVEQGRVVGICAAGDAIRADVVVAADGALSFIAEKAGLRSRHKPSNFAVGVKEVLELPAEVIEDRFNLAPGEGAAQLFFGAITEGITGGGFVYTNQRSLSLGLVVGLKGLKDGESIGRVHQLMERFKARPEIQVMIAGGELVEYSAHTIPEGGLDALPRLFGDGIIVAGDAAGLALNMGLTVRGMDFALASGVLAARAIARARQQRDYSAATLADYRSLLESSFVFKDLKTFRHMPRFLDNPRIFDTYPKTVCGLLEELLWIGEGGKTKLSTTMLRKIRSILGVSTLRDLWSLRKV
ncbi:MAG: FAD-dependent oxidoreductase [Pirellulales bacterium]